MKAFTRNNKVEILSIVGSFSSIASLLLVFFNKLDLMKVALIIIALIFSFSIEWMLAITGVSLFKRLPYQSELSLRISCLIAGLVILIVIGAFLFWGAYVVLVDVVGLINSLIQGTRHYDVGL